LSQRFQFLRKGYFTLDNKDTWDRMIFNRTVTLKDAWAKEQKKG
jgi:glutaminyl-tRNA synthetase